MARLLFVLIAVAVTFMVYSLVDTIFRPARLIRALPKWAWVLIVIFIPVLGGVLWFLIGRGRRSNAPMNRMTAPDDDPEFLRGLNSNGSGSTRRPSANMPTPESTDENIRDLEKRFADLNFEGPDSPSTDKPGSGASGAGKTGSGKTGSGKTGSGKAVTGEPVSGEDDSNTGRSDRKPGPAA
jgi:hypothetical protein